MFKLDPTELPRLQRVGLKRGWPDFSIVYRQLFGVERKAAPLRDRQTKEAATDIGRPNTTAPHPDSTPY